MESKGKGGRGRNWEFVIDTYTLLILCINRQLMRTYCIAQGTLLNALWSPKKEGNTTKGVYV